jgi:hypothetical protein
VLAHTRHNACDVPKLFQKYAKSPFDPKLGTQKLDIKHKTGDLFFFVMPAYMTILTFMVYDG